MIIIVRVEEQHSSFSTVVGRYVKCDGVALTYIMLRTLIFFFTNLAASD